MTKLWTLILFAFGLSAQANSLVEDLGVNLTRSFTEEIAALRCGTAPWNVLGPEHFLNGSSGTQWRVQSYQLVPSNGGYRLTLRAIGVYHPSPTAVRDRFEQISDEEFYCTRNNWKRKNLTGKVSARRASTYFETSRSITQKREYFHRTLVESDFRQERFLYVGWGSVRVLDEAKNSIETTLGQFGSGYERSYSFLNEDGINARESRTMSEFLQLKVPACAILMPDSRTLTTCDQKYASYQFSSSGTGSVYYSRMKGFGYGSSVVERYSLESDWNVITEEGHNGGPSTSRAAVRRNGDFVAAQLRTNGNSTTARYSRAQYDTINGKLTRFRNNLKNFFLPEGVELHDEIVQTADAAFDEHYALNNTCCEINNIWW